MKYTSEEILRNITLYPKDVKNGKLTNVFFKRKDISKFKKKLLIKDRKY